MTPRFVSDTLAPAGSPGNPFRATGISYHGGGGTEERQGAFVSVFACGPLILHPLGHVVVSRQTTL